MRKVRERTIVARHHCPFVNRPDPIVFIQLPAIRQIILDETWLEAERRGCSVAADDRAVRDNVCKVVLRIGAQLRETSLRKMAGAPRLIPYPDTCGAA